MWTNAKLRCIETEIDNESEGIAITIKCNEAGILKLEEHLDEFDNYSFRISCMYLCWDDEDIPTFKRWGLME